MLNLFRMNVIKMFHMKSLYILMLVSVLLSVIFISESKQYSTEGTAQQTEESAQPETEEYIGGIKVDTESVNRSIVWYVAEFPASGFMLVLVGIFMSIFAMSERDSGFIKNLTACEQHKWMIIVSKLFPAVICTILFQVALLVALIVVNLIYGCPIPFGNPLELLPVAGLQILLHTAFSAFVLLSAEVFRNMIACVVVNLLLGMGILGELVAQFAPKVLPYMICSRVKVTSMPLNPKFAGTTLVVAVLSLLIYTLLSCFVSHRRDVC